MGVKVQLLHSKHPPHLQVSANLPFKGQQEQEKIMELFKDLSAALKVLKFKSLAENMLELKAYDSYSWVHFVVK